MCVRKKRVKELSELIRRWTLHLFKKGKSHSASESASSKWKNWQKGEWTVSAELRALSHRKNQHTNISWKIRDGGGWKITVLGYTATLRLTTATSICYSYLRKSLVYSFVKQIKFPAVCLHGSVEFILFSVNIFMIHFSPLWSYELLISCNANPLF